MPLTTEQKRAIVKYVVEVSAKAIFEDCKEFQELDDPFELEDDIYDFVEQLKEQALASI